jgi:CO/xanthine dehydrogenase FAD-binding subunit
MQGTLVGRQLLEPRSLADAVKMLRDEGPLVPMAGCTDLYVALNFGTLGPTRFLNLWNLDALRRIEARGHTLRIGALTTYTEIIRSGVIRRRLPMLAAAAREIGGVQIQNRGTIGGNVANASPAGDTLPVLLAADAVVVLRSADGTRRVPMTSFYTGYRQTAARPEELIVSFDIPAVKGRQWFRKVGTRAAQAIAKIVVAGVWDEARAGARPRLAMGSVAPTPLRLSHTEQALGSGVSLAEVQEILQREIAPIDDLRSTAEYRRRVAANLVAQFYEHRGDGGHSSIHTGTQGSQREHSSGARLRPAK